MPSYSIDQTFEDEESDPVFSRINRLNRLLDGLDERGLILSVAAFAEESLGDLISAFLIDGAAANALVEGFNAPLGTLSSRIKMAFALGLVTQEQYEDLERLRRIRNEFSHSWEKISFSDQKILSQINSLNYNWIDDKFPETPIEKVKSSLGLLLVELAVTKNQIKTKEVRLKVLGSRLVSMVSGAVDSKVGQCERKFSSLKAELENAEGEYRKFLLFRWDAWLFKLGMVWASAPADRRSEIDKLRLRCEQEKPA